jgi:hypothetical protein
MYVQRAGQTGLSDAGRRNATDPTGHSQTTKSDGSSVSRGGQFGHFQPVSSSSPAVDMATSNRRGMLGMGGTGGDGPRLGHPRSGPELITVDMPEPSDETPRTS